MISEENTEQNTAYETASARKTVYRSRKEPLAFLEPLLLPVFLAAILCTAAGAVGYALIGFLPLSGRAGSFPHNFVFAANSLGHLLFNVSIVLGLAQISVRLTDIAKLLRSNRDDD